MTNPLSNSICRREVLVVLLVVALSAGCRRRPQSLIPSPNGFMTLHTWIENRKSDPTTYLCVVFQIRDENGRVLHEENTRASDAMRWRMSWDSDNVVRLESSDIGTYFWQLQPNGNWEKLSRPISERNENERRPKRPEPPTRSESVHRTSMRRPMRSAKITVLT
jgi:hypothetical protein